MTSPAQGLPGTSSPDEVPELYRHYQELRKNPPFVTDAARGNLVVARYADVAAACRHPQLVMARVLAPALAMPESLQPVIRPAMRTLSRMMLFTDPPDHTRLRGLANRAFTPRAVEGMRSRIREIADNLLDRIAGPGPVDLIGTYANWLPIQVIAEMLGAELEDQRAIKRWSDDFALLISGSRQTAIVVAARGAWGVYCLQRYMRRLVRRKRANPDTSLLDALIAAEESGDVLTEQELVSNALLLLAAGHITTTNLIGNGLLALLQHPDQLDLLRQQPELMPQAVEEMLRYESPLQFTGRVAGVDTVINGFRVKTGQTLVLGLGAANHDPEQFPHPDRLDIQRTENRHLAFAGGAHFCLGAALARLEGQIAIDAILRRFPNLRLADQQVEWRNAGVIRGLKRLPVYLQ